MRLTSFLLNEGRSVEMDLNDAINTIKTDCSNQYNNTTPIYRGVRESKKALYIDPKSGKPRKSANTSNIYTYVIDNSPKWKKYPKRSRSIICSTDSHYSASFGWVYKVFPFNGSKIGVCSGSDMWASISELSTYDLDLDSFNYSIRSLFYTYNIRYDESTYKSFKNSINKLNTYINDDYELFEENIDYSSILTKFKKGDNLYQFIENILDPRKNDFELKKAGDKLPERREVWTDGKSIMIANDIAEGMNL